MPTDALPLLGLAAALAVGTITPGPSFLMVARTAVAAGWADGLAAAIGMGLGGVIFCLVALLGLQALIQGVPWLYLAFQVLGGTYLVVLGTRLWRGARADLPDAPRGSGPGRLSLRGTLLTGLATQLSNPKTALVYAAIFAAFLPGGTSLPIGTALLVFVFVLETGWYTLVALAMSSERPRRTYLAGKSWIDRLAGGVLMALGLRLALTPLLA